MSILTRQISKYLEYCQYQKRLDEKTLKAYRIDLRQFSEQLPSTDIPDISQAILEDYLICLHKNYKPKTVKRKIASIKAFFHYLEYREVIEKNPFDKIQIKFREPVILPKTIPLHILFKHFLLLCCCKVFSCSYSWFIFQICIWSCFTTTPINTFTNFPLWWTSFTC